MNDILLQIGRMEENYPDKGQNRSIDATFVVCRLFFLFRTIFDRIKFLSRLPVTNSHNYDSIEKTEESSFIIIHQYLYP
jgi:hypothetical protein